MTISDKAAEFAGFPVVGYEGAAGIVLPVMPRLELRSADGSEFWAISLNRDRITTQSGKVGAAGKTQTKKQANHTAAQKKYRELLAEKAQAGFVPPPLRRELHLAVDP